MSSKKERKKKEERREITPRENREERKWAKIVRATNIWDGELKIKKVDGEKKNKKTLAKNQKIEYHQNRKLYKKKQLSKKYQFSKS